MNIKNDLDRYDMRKVILQEAHQFADGFTCVDEAKLSLSKKYTRVCVLGMGGSALGANIVDMYIQKMSQYGEFPYVSVEPHRSYNLPLQSTENTLHIVCSHSGNTEETLSVLQEITEKKFPVVGVSSGGKLEQICGEQNIPFIKLPIPFENFQPRMASGHFFSVLLGIMIQGGLVPEKVKDDILNQVDQLEKDIQGQESLGKEIASFLYTKTPLIYTTEQWKYLAMIWKIKINENAKTPAFWNYFPELNHNEMVGFTQPQADFAFLLLRERNDDPRILRRYEVFEEIMLKKGFSLKKVDIQSNSVYTTIFSTLALGDWASYYLALSYGIDPTPVDMVETFKKML
jgi:glucose/mannose-6-phosphate isomerase